MKQTQKSIFQLFLLVGTFIPIIFANYSPCLDQANIDLPCTSCANQSGNNEVCCDSLNLDHCSTPSTTIDGCDACALCDNNYQLQNGNCSPCSLIDADCSTCGNGICLSCATLFLQDSQCLGSCKSGFAPDGSNICQQCSSALDGSGCFSCVDIANCDTSCTTQYPQAQGFICVDCDDTQCNQLGCFDINSSYNINNGQCECNQGYADPTNIGICTCDSANGYVDDGGICVTCNDKFGGQNNIDTCDLCDFNSCTDGTCTDGFGLLVGNCVACSSFGDPLTTCTSCESSFTNSGVSKCTAATCISDAYVFDSQNGRCIFCDTLAKDPSVSVCNKCTETAPGSFECTDGDCAGGASFVFNQATQQCDDCNALYGLQNGIDTCTSCSLTQCTAGSCTDNVNDEFDAVLGICRTKCASNQYFDGAQCVACTTITPRCTECDSTPYCTNADCLNSQYETTGVNGQECINCNTINDDCTDCSFDNVLGRAICDAVQCLVGKYEKTDVATGSKSCGECSDFDDPLKPDETCEECNEAIGCTKRTCPADISYDNAGTCIQCSTTFGVNCLTCDGLICLTDDCADGTYYDQVAKSCVACSLDWSLNCLTCDASSCLTNDCPDGQFYSQDQKSCVLCDDPTNGVTNCNLCSDAQTTTTCTGCSSGYVIDNSGATPFCNECSNAYTGLPGTCLTCDETQCLTIECLPGYFDNNLSCDLCTNQYVDSCDTCDSTGCLTFCPAGQVNALPCIPCWQFHQDDKTLTCDLAKSEASCLPGFVPLSGSCVQCSTAVADDTCAECSPVDYTTAQCDLNCVAGQYAYLGQCLDCSDKFGDNCAACSFSTCTTTCTNFQNAVNGACVAKTCQEVYGIRCLVCDFGLDLCTTTCSGGFYVDASANPNVCSDCTVPLGTECAACDDATTCSLDCSNFPGTHPTGGLCCNSDETEVDGACQACAVSYGPGCLTCDNNECLSCSASSFVLFGSCIPCAIHDINLGPLESCATCEELQCIDVCVAGQYAKDGVCNSCSDLGNCALCQTEIDQTVTCTLPCAVDEYPENGGCQSCPDAIPGCATCTSSVECTLLCVAPEVPTDGICCLSNQYNDNGACADCTAVHGPFCQTCSGAASCDTCRFGKDANDLCIEQCELNQYGTYPDCTDCSTIDANCKTCTDANTCTLCQDDQGNQQYINGLECVDTCPTGSFDAGSFTCQTCTGGCLDCDDAATCNDCGAGNYFNSATPGCEPCPVSLGADCTACSIDGTSCTDCGTGNYFNSGSGSCDTCSNAIADCEECSDDGVNGLVCSKCSDRHQWDGSACVDIPCTVTDCSACDADIDVCEACGNSKVLDLDTNTCEDNCGDGRYDNAGTCADCIDNCKTCSNDQVCEDCGAQFLKADGTCTDNCGDFFFSDGSATPKVCVSCADVHCLTCSSGNAGGCTACENGWFDDGNGGCTDVSPQPCAGLCEPWTNKIYKPGQKACHDDRCFTARYETRLNFDEPDIYSWSAYWTVNYDITCATAAPYDKNKVYNTGQFVIFNGTCWRARWQNTAQWWDGNLPGKGNSWTKQ